MSKYQYDYEFRRAVSSRDVAAAIIRWHRRMWALMHGDWWQP